MPPRKIDLLDAADRQIRKVFDPHIAFDFRDGNIELGDEFIVVPKGREHRPRSLSEKPVVLMFEPATALNTGDANSDLTATQLNRL